MDVTAPAQPKVQALNRAELAARDIALGGLAGAIAGIVVGGLGGRLAMLAAARLNPQATGLLTENGEVIGRFTLNGTLAILVFGGLFAGFLGGFVWVVVRPWLPTGGPLRLLAVAVIALALGGPLLIQPDNPDFIVLREDALVVTVLLAVVVAVGLAVALIDDRLRRRFPVERTGNGLVAAWAIVTGLGLILIGPMAASVYLSAGNCTCFAAPFVPGWALVVAGVATLVAWARGRDSMLAGVVPLVLVGRGAVVVATIFGLLRIGDVVRRIVSS